MYSYIYRGCHRGRDRMVVGFTTTCAISAYHHYSCEIEPCLWRGVLDTTLCDKVCQWLATGRWFSPVLRFPPPRYNWNIVESGIKHHKHKPKHLYTEVNLGQVLKPNILISKNSYLISLVITLVPSLVS
jgi:hypothetical protein